MHTEIEALRALVYTAYDLIDRGETCFDYALMLKVKGAKAAEYVCSEAIQLLGGLGVVKETGIERFYRDVKTYQIAGGSLEAYIEGMTMFMPKPAQNL